MENRPLRPLYKLGTTVTANPTELRQVLQLN